MSVELTPLSNALKTIIRDLSCQLSNETISLSDALARVTSEAIKSNINVPGFDNSAMDGFALRCEDFCAGSSIDVAARVQAGDEAKSLPKGKVARIFTGAMMPANANAVIPQENVEYDEKTVHFPETLKAPKLGANIRLSGQDISNNETIIGAGKTVQAQDIGLIASIGKNKIDVFRKLKVGILSTGDELLEPGEEMREGKIFNSNRYLLQGFLNKLNIDLIDYGVCSDSLAETKVVLSKAAKECDCVISSGGVSVGEEDYVKQSVDALGQMNIWRLAIKPGKPFAYGKVIDKPFFGLPGNPVAVFVIFLLILKPCLDKLRGVSDKDIEEGLALRLQPTVLPVDFDFKANKKRVDYLRVSLKQKDGKTFLHAYPNQSSGVLSSTISTDGLAVVPINTEVKRGDELGFISYQALLDS